MSTLKRAIGLPAATALVVGTIIGSSIFVQASEITQPGAASRSRWCWRGPWPGVLTLIGALVCAELSSAYPRTGGVYVFLKEIYSPTARLRLGLGDVLDDAHRHPGGDRDGVCALCGVLRAARRHRPRGWWRSRRSWCCRRSITSASSLAAACRSAFTAGEGAGGAGDHRARLGAAAATCRPSRWRRRRPTVTLTQLPARRRRGPVRLRRLAHGHLHRRRNRRTRRAPFRASLMIGIVDRHGLLHRLERGLPARAADREGDDVDARRGGYVRGAGRRRRRRRDLRAGHVQRLRRAERHRARRPARLLPDGAGRTCVQVVQPPAPDVPDARIARSSCRRSGRRCWC